MGSRVFQVGVENKPVETKRANEEPPWLRRIGEGHPSFVEKILAEEAFSGVSESAKRLVREIKTAHEYDDDEPNIDKVLIWYMCEAISKYDPEKGITLDHAFGLVDKNPGRKKNDEHKQFKLAAEYLVYAYRENEITDVEKGRNLRTDLAELGQKRKLKVPEKQLTSSFVQMKNISQRRLRTALEKHDQMASILAYWAINQGGEI